MSVGQETNTLLYFMKSLWLRGGEVPRKMD
jgi:hypothetical protein